MLVLSVTHKLKLFSSFRSFSKMAYSIVEKGTLYSEDYRVYFKNEKGFISPLHDIPMYANEEKKIFNMVVEIPRWTNAKMEINLKECLNPIKQDIKKGLPRFVHNCFPHKGYIWNYGAIPQTWEDPNIVDENTKAKGDNDPIDCIEIGRRLAKRGEVLQVKVLGTVALIDEGETDWKIIVIDVNDPLADQINNVTDIDKHFPGLLKATIEWFRIYKIPDGKPENQFAFNGEPKPVEFALKILTEVHEHWKKLISGVTDGKDISLFNTSLAGDKNQMSATEAEAMIARCPEVQPTKPTDSSVDYWHFIQLKY